MLEDDQLMEQSIKGGFKKSDQAEKSSRRK